MQVPVAGGVPLEQLGVTATPCGSVTDVCPCEALRCGAVPLPLADAGQLDGNRWPSDAGAGVPAPNLVIAAYAGLASFSGCGSASTACTSTEGPALSHFVNRISTSL